MQGNIFRTPAAAAATADAAGRTQRDYTRVPQELDAYAECLDDDAALRPTIIESDGDWNKRFQKSLLKGMATTTMNKDEQQIAKNAAFDLLDALTKSGGLPLEHASLHVVVGATHNFDHSLIETIVQDNVNPISKLERSMLIMGLTVHQQHQTELVPPSQHHRLEATMPQLFVSMDRNS